MTVRGRFLAILLVCTVPSGCTAPAATLELIAAARKGITFATEDAAARQEEAISRLQAQTAALDAAFDADVRLVAAGQLADTDGKALALTAEWVISARKGYAAARGILAEQARSSEAAHAAAMDNLAAADESLDMAAQLIVSHWDAAERIKQHVLSLQKETPE